MNGANFTKNKLSTTHRELPFGNIVQNTNLINEKAVDVGSNDCNPENVFEEIELSRNVFFVNNCPQKNDIWFLKIEILN